MLEVTDEKLKAKILEEFNKKNKTDKMVYWWQTKKKIL